MVDIDQPLPDLRADERYRDAWVVLCRGGIPRSVVILDLTAGESAIQDRLSQSLAQAVASEPSILELPRVPDGDLPRISLVIPTVVARVDDLGLCLDNVEQLDYPNFDVVLVDNRRVIPTPDPLVAIVRDRRGLRVVREPVPGASAARNAGVAHAEGDVIVFTDDDVRVERQWLRAIGTRMTLDPELDALTGLILPAELESPAQIWFEQYFGGMGSERTFASVTLEADPTCWWPFRGSRVLVRDSKGAKIKTFSIYGVGAYGASANMAVKKSAFERVGGFDVILGIGTPTFGGEDLGVMINILWTGGRIAYEPAAFANHRHRREYPELLKQIDGYGIGLTAMLTSLTLNDPRHLLSIASQLPRALRWKATQGVERARKTRANPNSNDAPVPRYPPGLFKREIWAFLRGPFAYARSRWEFRHTPFESGVKTAQ
jgi:glycosyltransferase involved in cell wall biosynthesis